MKVLVTRHGQTDWNLLEKLQGQTDVELNETGRKQAEEAGESIRNERIDLIITSPLKRAKETAQIINTRFNVPVIEEERLIERGFGEWEGMSIREYQKMKEQHPKMRETRNYKKNVSLRKLEPMKAFCDRVYEALNELTETYKDKNILIVTHGGTTFPIQCFFRGLPREEITGKEAIKNLHNCEIARFEYKSKRD